MKNLILIAAPGAGKGTLANALVEKYNYIHISTGDLLRDIVKSGTPLGEKIKGIQEKGLLVDDELVYEVLKNRLEKPDVKNGIILDGFPRNIEQAKKYDEIISELNIDLGEAILLDVDESILINRITGRRICSKCGEIYNINNPEMMPKNEGVCDKCGSDLYQRNDDNEESLKVRYKTFVEQTKPLIDFYENKNCLSRVDAGNNPDDTLNQVSEIIKEV